MKYKVIITDIDNKVMGLKEFKTRRKAKNFAKLVIQSNRYRFAEVVKTIKNYSHL